MSEINNEEKNSTSFKTEKELLEFLKSRIQNDVVFSNFINNINSFLYEIYHVEGITNELQKKLQFYLSVLINISIFMDHDLFLNVSNQIEKLIYNQYDKNLVN